MPGLSQTKKHPTISIRRRPEDAAEETESHILIPKRSRHPTPQIRRREAVEEIEQLPHPLFEPRREHPRPTIRAHAIPPSEHIERGFTRPFKNDGPIFLSTPMASNTNAQSILTATEGTAWRIIYIEAWPDTADVEYLEIYWHTYTNIDVAGAASRGLFRVPFNSAYERFTRSWGVGTGPVGTPGHQFTMRLNSNNAGQTMYIGVWAKPEKEAPIG